MAAKNSGSIRKSGKEVPGRHHDREGCAGPPSHTAQIDAQLLLNGDTFPLTPTSSRAQLNDGATSHEFPRFYISLFGQRFSQLTSKAPSLSFANLFVPQFAQMPTWERPSPWLRCW